MRKKRNGCAKSIPLFASAAVVSIEMNEESKNQEQSQPEAAKPSPKEKPTKPERSPGKREIPKECAVCNKSIKKRWYYREGKYYCGKGCWKKSKEQKETSEKKPEDK